MPNELLAALKAADQIIENTYGAAGPLECIEGSLVAFDWGMVKTAIQNAEQPKTIEQRLLFVAQELRAINLLPLTKEQNDILTDIDDSNLDRAIAKLTGEWDPTPKEPSYD